MGVWVGVLLFLWVFAFVLGWFVVLGLFWGFCLLQLWPAELYL
jgi:hypothetical protein